ncbi:MAG: response regulator [Lachnospiraceae bacterium]|nr:response regulator [Lachnospiraceae bacterium]
METFYRIFEVAGMLISLLCCVSVIRAKPSHIQQKLLITCIWGLTTTFGNVMEIFATSPEAAMVAFKVAYVGKCYIVTSALVFVSSYGSVRLPRGLVPFLGIANTAALAAVMTCERHRLYYTVIDYEIRPSGRAAMLLEHGPVYYLWMTLVFVGSGMYLIIAIRELMRSERVAKLRMTAVFMAVAIPVAVAVAFLVLSPVYFDPSTFAITMTEVCFLFAVHRYGLLDTLELAQERIIEDTQHGIVVVDNTKSTILYQNQSAEALIKRIMEKNGSFDLEQFVKVREHVYEIDGRHYEFHLADLMQSADSSEIQGYVVWIFDMTFIDGYTSEMIRLKEEAENASQAKTDFLANISHEIRTPMNSIVGYAELALKNHDTQIVNGYLRKIKKSSDILLHIINELIDITKIESGKMKLVKVKYRFNELIDEIRHMVEIPAGYAGLAFLVQIDSALPVWFYDDKVKVQEIILNLVTNSIKYTPQGSVILRVHLKEIVDKRALICIEVEDTGVGMSESESETAFAKFERVDRKNNYHVQGSGLGLSIVKSFVDMMDGTVSYESEIGKGTRFVVDIWQELDCDTQAELTEDVPTQNDDGAHDKDTGEECGNSGAENAGAESSGAVQTAPEAPEEAEINSGHVLIVDDNELNLDVASGIMELMGMTTQTAESGMKCLELLESGEMPDIIFMDYMMPEMDGLETMQKIRALEGAIAKVPVVLLTANAVTGVKEEMLEEGFDDFLSKPIAIEDLRRILIRFLGEKGCQDMETSI